MWICHGLGPELVLHFLPLDAVAILHLVIIGMLASMKVLDLLGETALPWRRGNHHPI